MTNGMLTGIQLKNYKCFKDSGMINLSRITLFTGANGTGKSSVMQSLLMLAQSIKSNGGTDGLHINGDYIRLGDFGDILYSHAANRSPIGIDIHSESNNVSHSFTSEFKANDNDIVAQYIKLEEDKHSYIQESSLAPVDTSDDTSLITADKEQVVVKKGSFNNDFSFDFEVAPIRDLATFNELKNVYYIRADRHGPRESEQIEHRSSINDIGTRGEFIFSTLYNQGSVFLEEVRSYLSRILGGANIKMSVDNTDYRLYLDSVDGNEYYKQINVGFAYSYVLPIVVATLLSKNKTKIFIENPEAHLHPGAQSQLMAFLYEQAISKDLQIIIETHSDHIINSCLVGLVDNKISLGDLSIYYFRRDNDSKECVPVYLQCTSNGRIRNSPPGFFDQMDIDLDKLLEY